MKTKYCIITVLLICAIVVIVMACPSVLEKIRYAREDREKWEQLCEMGRQDKLYFNELTEYCKEHENMYMEISEETFDYLDKGLSMKEACENIENNATIESKEILEKTTLGYPDYSEKELYGNGLYYTYMRSYIYIIYIHQYSKELDEYITSMVYTTTEKINDHLYVCYTELPYT